MIATDDPHYAKAVITILACLEDGDIFDGDTAAAIVFLMEMCLHLGISDIDPGSSRQYAKAFERIAFDFMAYAKEHEEK